MPSQFRDNSMPMPSAMTDLLPDDGTAQIAPINWLRSSMWGEEDFIEICEVEIDLISEEPCTLFRFNASHKYLYQILNPQV